MALILSSGAGSGSGVPKITRQRLSAMSRARSRRRWLQSSCFHSTRITIWLASSLKLSLRRKCLAEDFFGFV